MSLKKILFNTLLIATLPATGKVLLPNYITDNMIVQQNSTIKIKGHAAPGSKVSVHAGWSERPSVAKADSNGAFAVDIPTPSAGGPYSILFIDKDGKKVIENVLSGEVWLCSGQSNMEFPVQGWTTVMDYDQVVATAYHPDIRLLQVKKTTAFSPQEDVEVNNGGWQICSSASMADFSAIAYFYAREISQKLGVPVGVIDTTWGGTPAEAWTSAEALGSVPGFESELSDLVEAGYDADKLNEIYSRRINGWMNLAKTSKTDFDKASLQPGWKPILSPEYWEKTELPGFDGIVWMQKSIHIPDNMTGKELSLYFRAIDDEDVTYFNGVKVGEGSGFDTPRNYTIPAGIVKKGENVITIRVSDFGGEGGLAPGRAELFTDGTRIDLSGEWQYSIDTDFSQLPPKPVSPQGSSYPSVLYNAMLSPLKDMPVKGVLWYQGCANVGRAEQYAPLFKSLINDWRKLWGENMPFYFVQLAGYLQPKPVQPDSEWAALRNAQSKVLELDNTAMAVASDLGNPDDIHPKDKQDVAHRLALIALNRDYGQKVIYEAPKCESIKKEGESLVLSFDAPVYPTSSAITGFIIADKDGNFVTATPAMVNDHTIRLSALGVTSPVAVRYNWADFPGGNLYGATGLPVAPFANDK